MPKAREERGITHGIRRLGLLGGPGNKAPRLLALRCTYTAPLEICRVLVGSAAQRLLDGCPLRLSTCF